jgi:hypothetical protein
LAPAEEVSRPPEFQRNWRQEREQRELKANNEGEDASLDEEMRPGAVAVPAVFTGRTSPSVLSGEPRGPSAFDQQSLIVAELAEASQEDEELRRRNQELEQEDKELRRRLQEFEIEELRRRNQELEHIVNGAVQGTVIVENSGAGDHDQPFGRKERRFWRRTQNSGAGDHDQNAAPSPGDHDQNAASSPFFGRKGIRFWIGAAFALLLVVGAILGVTISFTTNNNNNNSSSNNKDSKGSPPQPSPAPSKSCILDIEIDCIPESDLLGDRCDSIPICNQLCNQRASEMSFRYNGGDCSQSLNSQPSSLFECNDFNGGPPSEEGVVAWIEAFELGRRETYFSGFVPVGEVFTLFAEEKISANQNITVYDPKGETDRSNIVRQENTMQTIKYHSSCAWNLFLNDIFGSVQLVEFVNEVQGRVTCFIKAILALDIQIPIFTTNGDNSVRLTSLEMLTNVFGIIDKTEEVNGFVVNGMVDEPIPIEITLDLTVRQSYTFFTTIVGETVSGGDECNGDNFFEFVA